MKTTGLTFFLEKAAEIPTECNYIALKRNNLTKVRDIKKSF